MSKSFEDVKIPKDIQCNCETIIPPKGEIHIMVKAFYDNRQWAAITVFKETEDFQEFLGKMGLFSHATAKSLVKAGLLTGEYAENYRKEYGIK